MKTRNLVGITCLAISIPFAALAHSPLFSCTKESGTSIVCEGGFSDGSSAAGVAVRVVDMQDKVLMQDKLDAASKYTFTPPAGDFHVVFVAGENHQVTVFSGDID